MKRFVVSMLLITMCALVTLSACRNDSGNNNNDSFSLSLVGTATLEGVTVGGPPKPVPMQETVDGIFELELMLRNGWLIISADRFPDWEGRWFLPADDGSGILPELTNVGPGDMVGTELWKNGNGGEGGPKWQVTAAAKYRVTVDTERLLLSFVKTGEFEGGGGGTDDTFTNMWFIDCAEERPWAYPMTEGVNGTWTYSETIQGSSYVKFYGGTEEPDKWDDGTASDYENKWFSPFVDGELASGTRDFDYGADNGFAWFIGFGGEYTITLDPETGTVTFESPVLHQDNIVYLVDAKDPPLLAVNAYEMTETATTGTYTWQGVLSGWYKFNINSKPAETYDEGIWIGPSTADKTPATSAEPAYSPSHEAWQVPEGVYTVTLKTTQPMTVFFDRTGDVTSDDVDNLYVIGLQQMRHESANFWDYPNNTARKMTKQDNGTFTWTFNFGGDSQRYFRIQNFDSGAIYYPDAAASFSMTASTKYKMLTRLEALGKYSGIDLISWQVGVTGNQTIHVDINNKEVWYTSAIGTPVNPDDGENATGTTPPGSPIAILGHNNNWDQMSAAAIDMIQSPNNVYTYTGAFSGPTIQFRYKQAGGANIANANYQNAASGGTWSIAAGNNQTFGVTGGTTYTIVINMTEGQVTFTVQ